MGVAGDIYQLVMETELQGELCYNIFWYRITASIGNNTDALGVIAAFDQDFLPVLQTIITDDATVQSVTAVNWRDPSDFAIATGLSNVQGLVGGDPLPVRYCWSFTYQQTRPGLKPGSKRFAGIPEECLIVGQLNPSFSDEVANVNTALVSSISFGSVGAVPVIVRRQIAGVDVLPPLGQTITQFWQPTVARLAGFTDQRTRRPT